MKRCKIETRFKFICAVLATGVMCSSIVYTQMDLVEICTPKNGTFAALEMLLTEDVDVIFGPICSGGTLQAAYDVEVL